MKRDDILTCFKNAIAKDEDLRRCIPEIVEQIYGYVNIISSLRDSDMQKKIHYIMKAFFEENKTWEEIAADLEMEPKEVWKIYKNIEEEVGTILLTCVMDLVEQGKLKCPVIKKMMDNFMFTDPNSMNEELYEMILYRAAYNYIKSFSEHYTISRTNRYTKKYKMLQMF